MLTDEEKTHLHAALTALADGDAPWGTVAALARLAEQGTDVSVDFSTRDTLGAPVIIARRSAPAAPADLTPRQAQVCRLLAEGQSNKSIAATLGISPATAKDHVHAILDRLGLQSRSEVIAHLHRGSD